jgi:hypothetical protein
MARRLPRLTSTLACLGLLLSCATEQGVRSVDTRADDDRGRTERTDPDTTGGGADETTVPTAAAKDWTVMVYMAADNNLEPAAVADMLEMKQGAAENMNLLVFIDRAEGFSDEPIDELGDFTDARVVEVTTDGFKDLGIAQETAMSNPATLESFVGQIAARYPAEHTALVLWDHGAGWFGFTQDEQNPGDILDPNEVTSAISAGLQSAGAERLDVVFYDACLMADLAVAEALQPVARYMVASQELVPGHGADYRSLPDAVAGAPENFATSMIGGFQRQAREQGTDAEITMSLIDLDLIPNVSVALGQLTNTVGELSGAESVQLLQALGNSRAFAGFDEKDLGAFADQQLVTNPATLAALATVDSAIADAVIMHVEGEAYVGAKGLSVYSPPSLEALDPRYEQISGGQAWSRFVKSLYSRGTEAMNGVNPDLLAPPQALFDSDGINVIANVDPALIPNVVDISIGYGLDAAEEGVALLGQASLGIPTAATAGVVDGQGIVGGTTALMRYEISVDGFANSLLTYYSAALNPQTGFIVVTSPLAYYAPGETEKSTPLQLIAVLDANGEQRSVSVYAAQENGALGEFSPNPEGTFQTMIPLLSPQGSVDSFVFSEQFDTPASIPARMDALQMAFDPTEPGDGTRLSTTPLVAALTVTNSSGSSVTNLVPVPPGG